MEAEWWEGVERALPGQGRGTLRLLEGSLVSVRKEEKGTCLKLVYFTGKVNMGNHSILYMHLHTCIAYCSTDVQYIHVWQVEIEHYSVAHFNHVTAFQVL